MASPPRGVLARGMGRSYGDAAQCAGGTVIDMTGTGTAPEIDERAGTVRVSGGTRLDSLLEFLVPRGWFVPVTPGTRFVTVGGAIAADVHGKNHHADSSLGSHVRFLRLVSPNGAYDLEPDGPDGADQLFWSTIGGMGLTGIITEAVLGLLPITTPLIASVVRRFDGLDAVMDEMTTGDHHHRYSVAWLDGLARGRRLGRAVLTRGDHATIEDLPSHPRRSASQLSFAPSKSVPAPYLPGQILNPVAVKAFNSAHFRTAPINGATKWTSLSSFFYPLDALGSWGRLYGANGLIQYQFVVPPKSSEIIGTTMDHLQRAGYPPFLAVLKRMGPANPGLLSFPGEGWTLALDLPAGDARLGQVLDSLDSEVANAGGRIYLAKDSRLRPDLIEAMYPQVRRWRVIRDGVDPDRRLRSDLSQRLGLVDSSAALPLSQPQPTRPTSAAGMAL